MRSHKETALHWGKDALYCTYLEAVNVAHNEHFLCDVLHYNLWQRNVYSKVSKTVALRLHMLPLVIQSGWY